jgi:hypothetical protein
MGILRVWFFPLPLEVKKGTLHLWRLSSTEFFAKNLNLFKLKNEK